MAWVSRDTSSLRGSRRQPSAGTVSAAFARPPPPDHHMEPAGCDTLDGMSESIVVSGCAGFIRSHLTDRLLAGGHRILEIDSFDDCCRAFMNIGGGNRVILTQATLDEVTSVRPAVRAARGVGDVRDTWTGTSVVEHRANSWAEPTLRETLAQGSAWLAGRAGATDVVLAHRRRVRRVTQRRAAESTQGRPTDHRRMQWPR